MVVDPIRLRAFEHGEGLDEPPNIQGIRYPWCRGHDFDVADVERIGLAFGTYVRQQGGKRLAVGRDHRLSSESFRMALTKGLQATGCDIVDIGLVPTPCSIFPSFI